MLIIGKLAKYIMNDNLLGQQNKKRVLDYLKKETKEFDAVILIDYYCGLLTQIFIKF